MGNEQNESEVTAMHHIHLFISLLKITYYVQQKTSLLHTFKMMTIVRYVDTPNTRDDHTAIFFSKLSPIAVFAKRNNLALVPGHLNQWFRRDFDSKFEVFWAVSGV